MIDWKMLVSAFAALLVVSFVLMSGCGLDGLLSGAADSVGDWFGSSPFGGLLGGDSIRHVEVTLCPDSIKLMPEDDVNISSPSANFSGFGGGLELSPDSAVLSDPASGFRAEIDPEGMSISGLELEKMDIADVYFSIKPNITAENGSITIEGFLGNAMVEDSCLRLEGNVTGISTVIEGNKWQLF